MKKEVKMPEQKAYLVVISDKDIRIINEAAELSALEFDSVEEAEKVTIFEIAIKKKIKFDAKVTKVKLNLSE